MDSYLKNSKIHQSEKFNFPWNSYKFFEKLIQKTTPYVIN